MRGRFMDWGTWLLAATTLILGQLMGLTTERVRRRWTDADSKALRAAERGEAAALSVLDTLNGARRIFEAYDEVGTGPDEEAVYEVCHQLDRQLVQILSPPLRLELETLSRILWYAQHFVAQATGDSPRLVAFHVYRAGHALVGAFLRGDVSPSGSDNADHSIAKVAEYNIAATQADSALMKMLG